MTAPQAKAHLLQFSLRDFVEISTAIAPSAWCLGWSLWHPTDRMWLIGLMATGGLLTLLVSHYFRVRGWAYSLLFTYAGGLAFVVWIPSRVAIWFPEIVSSEMHRLAVVAMEKGQFALASAGLLLSLALAGAFAGHCLFRCVHRTYRSWIVTTQPPPRPSIWQWLLSGGQFLVEIVVVTALFAWIAFDLSRPTIRHVRRIESAQYTPDYNPKQTPFEAWTISRDGKRLLIADRSGLFHDISFSSGEDRLGVLNAAVLSPPETFAGSVEAIRECREGLLIIVYRSSVQPDGLSFQFLDIASHPPKHTELIANAKEMRALGLSPSGRLLVTQSRATELPGTESLLVWNLETMQPEVELDAAMIDGGCRDSYVLLDDLGNYFAADVPRQFKETGRTVPVFSRDQEAVALLKQVECLGDFQDPPLRFARDGKHVWGRFAGLRDFQSGIYPIIERVVSLETQNPTCSAASEYGGLNLVETLTFDPYFHRVLRLDYASEFDRFDGQLDGEEVDQFPILGVQCRQQVLRRRLRLADRSGRARLAMTMEMAPLSSSDDAPNQRRRLYSTSLRSAQFSLDGKTVVTVNDYDQMGLPVFDVWRLPAP